MLYGFKFVIGGAAPANLCKGFPQSIMAFLNHPEALNHIVELNGVTVL
jgi:hypothetical protein